MKKVLRYLSFLIAFILFVLNSNAQIHVNVDTLKIIWVENRCATRLENRLCVSDLGGKPISWSFMWEKKYSDYLFEARAGKNDTVISGGITPDTFNLKLVDWAASFAIPALYPGASYFVPVTFYETGNPGNRDSVIINIVRIKEFRVKQDYIAGYPLQCNDTSLNTTLPKGHCYETDFSTPSNTKVYKQGDTYIDQNFGSKITVATAPGSYNGYALPSPFSAHNKYLRVRNWSDNSYDFVNMAGTTVYSHVVLDPPYIPGKPVTSSFMWDNYDDEVIYQFQENTRLHQFNLSKKTDTVLIDFGIAPYNFPFVRNNISDQSQDDWVPLYTTLGTDSTGSDYGKIIVVNIRTLKVYTCPFDGSEANGGGFAYSGTYSIGISKGTDKVSGKMYLLMRSGKWPAIFEFDPLNGDLHFSFRFPETFYSNVVGNPAWEVNYGDYKCNGTDLCGGPGHNDFVQDDQGNIYLVTHGNMTACPYVNSWGAYLLRDRIKMRVPMEYGGSFREWWEGPLDHVGGALNAPCFVTSAGGPAPFRNPRDTTPYPTGVYHQEVAVYSLINGEVRFRRLAKTRSLSFSEWKDVNGNDSTNYALTYFSEPHAAISKDGKYVCWTSNQGNPNYFDAQKGTQVFIAETGFDFTTSAKEIQAIKNNMRVFPDPADAFVNIELESSSASEGMIQLFSMDGSVVFVQPENNTGATGISIEFAKVKHRTLHNKNDQ